MRKGWFKTKKENLKAKPQFRYFPLFYKLLSYFTEMYIFKIYTIYLVQG